LCVEKYIWCRYERKREKRGKRKKYIYIRVCIYIYFYLLSKQTFNWLFIIYTCVHIHIYYVYTLYKQGESCCNNRASPRASLIVNSFEETLGRAWWTGAYDPDKSHGIWSVDRLWRVESSRASARAKDRRDSHARFGSVHIGFLIFLIDVDCARSNFYPKLRTTEFDVSLNL